jgi:hypothetical protein
MSASSLRAPAVVLGATRSCRRTRRALGATAPLCKSQAGAAADAVALSSQRRALLLAAGVAALLPAQRARAAEANPEPLGGGARARARPTLSHAQRARSAFPQSCCVFEADGACGACQG